MIFRLFSAFAALSASRLNTSVTVTDCGQGTSLFTIDKLAINPTNPAPGDSFELHMEWTVPPGLTVTGGIAEYDTTWNFIPLEPTKEPLCQDIACPMGPGAYQNTSTSTWPSGISGYITSQMKWFDDSQALLACVEIGGTAEAVEKAASADSSKALVVYKSPGRYLRGGQA